MNSKIKLLLSFATLSVAGASLPASAAPIVYFGRTQVGRILSDYSITTDGTIGTVKQGNVLSFTVRLSDSQRAFSFSNLDGYFSVGRTGLEATASSLSITSITAGYFQGISFTSNAFVETKGYEGVGEYNQGDLSLGQSRAQAQLYTLSGGGFYSVPFSRFDFATTTPLPPFVPPVSVGAVPEPATWAMMILGFGVMGFAMRRRHMLVLTVSSSPDRSGLRLR